VLPVGVSEVGWPPVAGPEGLLGDAVEGDVAGALFPGVRSFRVTSTAPGRPEGSEVGVLVGEGACVPLWTVGGTEGVVVVADPVGGMIGASVRTGVGFEPPAGDNFGWAESAGVVLASEMAVGVWTGAGAVLAGAAARATSAFPSVDGSVLVAERRLTIAATPQIEPAATARPAATSSTVRAPLAVAERWLYT